MCVMEIGGLVMKVQDHELDDVLQEKINFKKKRHIKIASRLELTDDRAIECSQELDQLLNLVHNLRPLDRTSPKNQIEMRELRWEY
jgi:hypothetical protein